MENEKINGLNEQPIIASKKYVDEKIAICEHNYHILRGDFNEHIREEKREKIDNCKTFADIYERLVNIRTIINTTLFLSIIAHIILFILWVVLWLKY